MVPEPVPWNRRNRGFGTVTELKNQYSHNTTRSLRKLTVSALLVALGGEALDLSLVAVLSSVYSSNLSLNRLKQGNTLSISERLNIETNSLRVNLTS